MNAITIKQYTSPKAMLHDFGDWLEANAAVNNLLLGMLYRVERREEAGGEIDALMVGIFQDGRPAMALLQTPPRETMVVTRKDHWEPIVAQAAEWLQKNFPNLTGFIGSEPQVSALANHYAPGIRRLFRQHVMQLDRLTMPQPCPGTFRLSEPRDVDAIRDWAILFFKEALQKELSIDEATLLARAKILEKRFWVWDVDGQPVSMAGAERPTKNGITIVLVYTPTSERGKGYASNLTAQITDLQLRSGRKFCCLHTDADFPTSNKIYKALGYYQVGEGSILQYPQEK
jgi:uncharacterized protein